MTNRKGQTVFPARNPASGEDTEHAVQKHQGNANGGIGQNGEEKAD